MGEDKGLVRAVAVSRIAGRTRLGEKSQLLVTGYGDKMKGESRAATAFLAWMAGCPLLRWGTWREQRLWEGKEKVIVLCWAFRA